MMIEDKNKNIHFKQPSTQNLLSSPSNESNNNNDNSSNPLHNWMTKDEARFLIFGFAIWFTYFIAIPFIFETITFVLQIITTFSLPLSISFSLRVHKQYISNNTYIQNNPYFQLLERDYMGIVVVVFGYIVLIVNNIMIVNNVMEFMPKIIPALLAIGTALLVLYTASRNLFLLYTFYNGRTRKETSSPKHLHGSSSNNNGLQQSQSSPQKRHHHHQQQQQQQTESYKSREISCRILTNLFACVMFFDAMRLSNLDISDILLISAMLCIIILPNLYLWNQWRVQQKLHHDLQRRRLRSFRVAIIGSVVSFVILHFIVREAGSYLPIPMILYVATCVACMKVCAIGCIVEYAKICFVYWKNRNGNSYDSGGSNSSSKSSEKKDYEHGGDNQV